MKAARWYAQKDIRLDEVPEPFPKKGQVKIKVKWCGICGTDVTEYNAGPVFIPTTRPHPLTGMQPPVTLGHEFSGDVIEVGEGVTNVKVGDRVTVCPLIYCGTCYYCMWGIHNMCMRLATMGLGADGAFAEYTIAPSYGCHKIPENMDYETAAFAEPLSTLVRACRKAKISSGETVAIIGAGAMGLLALQCAKASGAGKVFVVEPVAKRRAMAERLGATAVFDPTAVDVGKGIAELTNGLRAEVAMECSGVPAGALAALAVTGRLGRIVHVGLQERPVEYPFFRLLVHEKEILTVQGYNDEFPTAILFLADGRVSVDPLITDKIRLAELVENGLERMVSRRDDVIRILVSPE